MSNLASDPKWSVLDPSVRPTDPEEYLRVALQWHFGAETGSPFWLSRVGKLGFDPLRDVHGYEDLALFPNVAVELRNVAVEDLIPRGYGPNPPAPKVFETSGTTGAPKRIIFMPDWVEATVDRMIADPAFAEREPANILVAMPSGPHETGSQYDWVAERQNVIKFCVDIDPRWVGKLTSHGKIDEVKVYVEHVLDQIEHVLETQHVGVLAITLPLLQACVGRPRLKELINTKIKVVFWGGASTTVNERFKLAYEDLPNVQLISRYSSTLIMQGARERDGSSADDDLVYDPYSPVVTFRVVDPQTAQPVGYGQRGQVVMNHISKGMFLPNNLEGDTAIRVQGLPGQIGDSVSSPKSIETVGGERVIEGIY